MEEFRCYVCHELFEADVLPLLSTEEVMLCDNCADVVTRLTGVREVRDGEEEDS